LLADDPATARLEVLTAKFQNKLQEFDKKMKELENWKADALPKVAAISNKVETSMVAEKEKDVLQIPSKTLTQIITDAKNKVREEEQRKYNEKLRQIKEEMKNSANSGGFRGNRKSERLQTIIDEAKKDFPENLDENDTESKKDLAKLLESNKKKKIISSKQK
jgi:hypothetical protein